MKSVATIFFSLLATALTAIAAPALEVHQAHGQDRPVITTPAAIIPLRLLDRDGNYTHTLEPRAIAVGDGADNTQQQFTFRADEDAPYMVCSRIPRAQAGCVVRVWFDSHGVEEEGRPDDGDGIYSEPSDIVFDPAEEDDESEPCVALGVDSGDGRGEQGLMVRKIDVDCP